MSGRLALGDAIRRSGVREARRQAPLRRATVTRADPLTIQMFGFGHPLTLANDFDLSQWMMLYQAKVGLKVGDMVFMSVEDTLTLMDVASDADVTAGFPAGGGAALQIEDEYADVMPTEPFVQFGVDTTLFNYDASLLQVADDPDNTRTTVRVQHVYTCLNAVLDFGAVGDGVTDDWPAIQEALDKAGANGGADVLLPGSTTLTGPFIFPTGFRQDYCGSYRITQGLKVHPWVSLIGEGRATTKIVADFGVSGTWDAITVGDTSPDFGTYGQCGLRNLSLAAVPASPVQAADYAGIVVGNHDTVIEHVTVGLKGTNNGGAPFVEGNLTGFDDHAVFDTGVMFNTAAFNTIAVKDLMACGISQGVWFGAMRGFAGAPVDIDGLFAYSQNGAAVRIWYAQHLKIHGLVVAGQQDILIDPPDSGGPAGRIRGNFVQGVDIRDVYSYSFPFFSDAALIAITPIADGFGGGPQTQGVLIDGYRSNGISFNPVLLIAHQDTLGNDVASGQFQDIAVRRLWINGCAPRIAHIGGCQGAYLEDSTFIDPIWGFFGSPPDAITLGAHAKHVTVRGNKILAFDPAASSNVKVNNGVSADAAADRYLIVENDFDPLRVATPVNAATSATKIVANNM